MIRLLSPPITPISSVHIGPPLKLVLTVNSTTELDAPSYIESPSHDAFTLHDPSASGV
jgi:hypothetical protein